MSLLDQTEPGFRRRCCEALRISKSSYYAPPKTLQLRDNIAAGELTKAHLQNPYYGVRRLALSLGWSINKTRRIRRIAGVQAEVVRRKHRYKRSVAEIPAPDNLIKSLAKYRNVLRPQDGLDYSGMTASHYDIWAQDFTYIKTRKGMVYLAIILKLATREIIGWSIAANHSAELVTAALLSALRRYEPPDILHSDRGSEYMSFSLEHVCKAAGIRMSASSPHSPWQNGYCERIMNTIKNEGSSFYAIDDTGQLMEAIAQRIYYYNHHRIHTQLKMPPAEYAKTISK